ncbi:hypothetical protein ABID82_007153 [Methylobacterium sp. PvP062]|uniref:Uncharacterized protein n=1 Tax=Methylobacterium radiotolerans TaxID=31998 RepID=A0ABV2NUH3_9HYPH|nr:hypothetical protein [Methylobacterium sp. PvP105]MBP2505708.1 hypothetical protein [Methylobacterium sp. PvP109]
MSRLWHAWGERHVTGSKWQGSNDPTSTMRPMRVGDTNAGPAPGGHGERADFRNGHVLVQDVVAMAAYGEARVSEEGVG